VAKILADRDIKELIGLVLVDADEGCIHPNGIKLRLGAQVYFHSTKEKRELRRGSFLKVNPGETVLISSIEKIDFTADTVHTVYPSKMLMGFITPTTTMMREGISQVATKIDAGFRGTLNWGLRNGSCKELLLEYGEPIFKLTIFLLDKDESPDVPYGERKEDDYQDTEGIKRSERRLPVDIPKNKIVYSSFEKLDPKKQLREAGYPFDHIGTELTTLHGKFEVVSKDVALLKDEFEKRTNALSDKIEQETGTLAGKFEEFRANFLERVSQVFNKRFWSIIGTLIGAGSLMYAVFSFLHSKNVGGILLAIIAGGGGIAVLLITFFLTRRIK